MMHQIFQLLRSAFFSPKVIHLNGLSYTHVSPCFGWRINFRAMHTRSTIFALSSSSGVAAIAVIRVSGPNASLVFKKMTKKAKLPEERKGTLCKIRDPLTNEMLDTALALWFPSPKSFTGDDLCELHIHGGIAVVKSVLNALQKLENFRYAEAGEFTKRAFLAGKLDLTEVEGLADLLNAETEAQQQQALKQMDGALCKTYTKWSSKIKRCLANIEAYIDFSEDQDLGSSVLDTVKNEIHMLKSEISFQLLDKRKGEKLRNGVFTVLLGRPNVGKSSLLNYLCQRDIAIVSPVAGTTRDIVEASLNLDGYLVNVSDTAGIRETQDSIEAEGVRRAKERSTKADILLLITEAKELLNFSDDIFNEKIDPVKYILEKELGRNLEEFLDCKPTESSVSKVSHLKNFDIIILLNKVDLLSECYMPKIQMLQRHNTSICAISCIKGTGMDKFLNIFTGKVKQICSQHRGEEPVITRERHRHCVEKCLESIMEFEDYLTIDTAIAAEKLRNAVNELGKITGKVQIHDILDIVFRDFCIGK